MVEKGTYPGGKQNVHLKKLNKLIVKRVFINRTDQGLLTNVRKILILCTLLKLDFFHFFPPNSPFTDYGLVKQIFGENSVCLLTQICLCYYINTIFQNTNCVGPTL